MYSPTKSVSKSGKLAACAMAGCLALSLSPLLMANTAHAAEAPSATAKVKVTTTKKSGSVRTIKVTKTGKLAGGVSYKLYTKGKKKAACAMSVKLSGKVASKYNVYYRVNAKGYGWLGWAKNGAKAGTAKLDMTKCQVKLVEKTAKQPNTDRKAFSGKNGFATKITGDAKTDAAIKKVAKSQSMNLNKCIKWVSKKVAYSPTGRSEMTKTSKFNASRFKTEAKSAFVTKRGDCYTFAAAGTALAQHLGYKAKATVGTYTSAKTGNVQVYSWISVKENGKNRICDPLNKRFSIVPTDEAYALFKQK